MVTMESWERWAVGGEPERYRYVVRLLVADDEGHLRPKMESRGSPEQGRIRAALLRCRLVERRMDFGALRAIVEAGDGGADL